MSQAPRIPNVEWEAHKSLIVDLYINQEKTLEEVMQHMATLGFRPSKPQWIRKLNVNWKLRKNSTKEEWEYASSLLSKRKANGTATELMMNDKVVPKKKMLKGLKRYTKPQPEQILEASDTFQAVVVRTPPASNEVRVSYSSLPCLKLQEMLRQYVHKNSARSTPQFSRYRQYFGSPRSNDQDGYLMDTEPPVLSTAKIHGLDDSKTAFETARRINDMFPTLDIYQVDNNAPEFVWIQLFQSLVLMSNNNLWDRVEGLDSFLEFFLELTDLEGHLEDLGNLLIKTIQTNGPLAANLLFSSISLKSIGSLDIMRMLLKNGLSADSTHPRHAYRPHWWTALHEAVYRDNQPSVILLIETGANRWSYLDTAGWKWCLGIDKGHACECSILELPDAENGKDAFEDLQHWSPPLFQAIRNGSTSCTQTLLDSGIDPNYYHPTLLTPLHCAIHMGNIAMVKLLIKAGAHPNIRPWEGLDAHLLDLMLWIPAVKKRKLVYTPLQSAVRSCDRQVVELLLDSGANPDMLHGIKGDEKLELYYEESHLSSLKMSVSTGQHRITSLLLTAGANVNYRVPETSTALQLACGLTSLPSPDRLVLVALLLVHGAEINALPAPSGGRTALQAACETGDHHLAKLLLSKGANQNWPATDHGGVTALEAAIRSGSEETISLLSGISGPGQLEHFLSQIDSEPTKRRALELVTSSGNERLLQKALELWANRNVFLSDEQVNLAMKASIDMGSLLLTKKLLIMHPRLVDSIFLEALWKKKDEISEWLITSSPLPPALNYGPPDQPSPLWVALHQRNHRAVRHLLKAGADPNQKSPHLCYRKGDSTTSCSRHSGGTLELPIIPAISHEDDACNRGLEMVKLLVRHGAKFNFAKGEFIRKPLLAYALNSSKYEMAEFLLSSGADPNTMDLHWISVLTSSLFTTVKLPPVSLVKSFLKHVTLVKGSRRCSPLQAITNCVTNTPSEIENLVEICRTLIDAGADVNDNLSHEGNMTALQRALVEPRKEALVEMLLNAGADIHAPAFPFAGRTALQAAAGAGNFEMVKRLVEMGADVNALPAEKSGATALQYAATTGHIEMAIFLLEHAALVNARVSIFGKTTLRRAVESGRLDMVQLLLENDKEPSTVENRCRDAARIAEERGFETITRLLREYRRL